MPPAIVGYTLERPIERRLGTPPTIAVGLLLGSAAMAAADRVGPTGRRRDDAGLVDALALGLAQACALIPGVSRNGMTLAAARLRGFDRADANALSRHVALPVIVGATALKGVRLARRGLPPAVAGAFAAGVGAAFASTLASVRIIRAVERDRSFAPYAAYRAALAGAGAPPRLAESLAMSESYAAAGVDTGQADRRRRRPRRRPAHHRARPAQRLGPAQRPLRLACCAWRRTSGSRWPPTAWARSSSSPSRPIASRRSASTAWP